MIPNETVAKTPPVPEPGTVRVQTVPGEPATPGSGAARVLHNPVSGERITLGDGPVPPGGTLSWELVLAPGGRVPSSHAHPEQEERFTVLEGTMRFRVGWRRLVARPGDVVTVPPGTVHHFANPGPAPARVAVRTTPALGMAGLLAVATALARDQHAAGRARPHLLDLALFMVTFDREVRAPVLPRAVVRAVMGPLSWLARAAGRDRRYRRLAGRA
jgi:quercetin dioxygenase-like cupin family protein